MRMYIYTYTTIYTDRNSIENDRSFIAVETFLYSNTLHRIAEEAKPRKQV
jgi:hypothetical protein